MVNQKPFKFNENNLCVLFKRLRISKKMNKSKKPFVNKLNSCLTPSSQSKLLFCNILKLKSVHLKESIKYDSFFFEKIKKQEESIPNYLKSLFIEITQNKNKLSSFGSIEKSFLDFNEWTTIINAFVVNLNKQKNLNLYDFLFDFIYFLRIISIESSFKTFVIDNRFCEI